MVILGDAIIIVISSTLIFMPISPMYNRRCQEAPSDIIC